MCCDKVLAENKEALKAIALARPSCSKSLRQHWRRIGVREFQQLSLEAELVSLWKQSRVALCGDACRVAGLSWLPMMLLWKPQALICLLLLLVVAADM